MYIREIEIYNYRNINNKTSISFKDGINVIIGANNAGKSNIISALSIVLGNSSKSLTIDDFCKNIKLEDIMEKPPRITISVIFSESSDEEEYSDDLLLISTCLTKLDKPYEGKITYEFFLPEKDIEDYKITMKNRNPKDINELFKIIEYEFLRKYTHKLYCGDPKYKTILDTEILSKIDFQFLDAVRDVERDLFSGKNALLKEIIDFFMDFDIKEDISKDISTKIKEINERKIDFSVKAKNLIANLHNRMKDSKQLIDGYSDMLGAKYRNNEISFDGSILDTELYSALSLIVKNETGINIPVTRNGLGYNNLIYITLLLAKMQKYSKGDYLGSNASIFPVLVIEEPESHLHPSMQYKFLKFIKESKGKSVKQVFITTHSPNITATVDLDNIIAINNINGEIIATDIEHIFENNDEDITSKKYIKRFLDVTKADMLFADKIILVEGIAEQLLVPIFAKYLNKDLEDNHISIINIGGRYFDHFIKLFDTGRNGIPKKVLCITDLDPERKEKISNSNKKTKYKACYPFELRKCVEDDEYYYKPSSNSTLDSIYPSNIKISTQEKYIGKTLEYQLYLDNPKCKELITSNISNKEELTTLIDSYIEGKSVDELYDILSSRGDENTRIVKSIKTSDIDDEDKKKHLIAARYLNSISKGEYALELSEILDCLIGCDIEFNVPQYIKEGIEWLVQE